MPKSQCVKGRMKFVRCFMSTEGGGETVVYKLGKHEIFPASVRFDIGHCDCESAFQWVLLCLVIVVFAE